MRIELRHDPLMERLSQSPASPSRNPKVWFKYFVEPRHWAERYTVISRNILNVGLAALILALVLFGESLSRFSYAFRPLPSDYLTRLEQVDGLYAAIGGGKVSTPRICVEDRKTKVQLACTTSSWFTRKSPDFIGKEASAWLDSSEGIGVVRIVVEGEEILSPGLIQQHLQDGIRKFGYLLAVFMVCFVFAIYRQRLLLKKRN